MAAAKKRGRYPFYIGDTQLNYLNYEEREHAPLKGEEKSSDSVHPHKSKRYKVRCDEKFKQRSSNSFQGGLAIVNFFQCAIKFECEVLMLRI
jgi:hypothetical protein